MIALPSRKLWTPWDRPTRPSLRDRRAWWRRIVDPLAAYAQGDVQLDSSGNVLLDSSDNAYIEGTGGSGTCCLYQARLCSDNSLAGIYVTKSKVAGGTYYFKYSGVCYSASLSDPAPCNSTPLVTGETAETDCTSCAGGGGCSQCCIGGGSGSLPTQFHVTISGVTTCPSTCYTCVANSVNPSGVNVNGTYILTQLPGKTPICTYSYLTSMSDQINCPGTTTPSAIAVGIVRLDASTTCGIVGWQVTVGDGLQSQYFRGFVAGDFPDCSHSITVSNVIGTCGECNVFNSPVGCQDVGIGVGTGGIAVITPC